MASVKWRLAAALASLLFGPCSPIYLRRGEKSVLSWAFGKKDKENMGGGSFAVLDIIILAVIAGFLVLRLRGVLGKRIGHDKPSEFFRKPEKPGDNVVPLPDRRPLDDAPDPAVVELGSANLPKDATPLATGLAQIKLADRGFDEKTFVTGAKAAFEMIVNAYAKGDLKTLRPLLSNEIYEEFAKSVRARIEAKETLETTFVGMKEASLVEAELQGKTAFVTARFVSDQINVTRDAAGAVISGDATQVVAITDLWTFARNTTSRDPNWLLVATDTP